MSERESGLDVTLRIEAEGATDTEMYDECREAVHSMALALARTDIRVCRKVADAMDRMHRAHSRPQYAIAAAYLREAIDRTDEAAETLERR